MAAFGVILIHTSSGGIKGFPLGSAPFMVCVSFNALGRFCVPAFLMVTGRLLLAPEKEIGIGKALREYAIPTFVILMFWAFLYALFLNFGMAMLDGEKIGFALMLRAVKDTVLFNHAGHLYYLLIIILVYLFLPMLKALADRAGEEVLRLIFYLWIFFAIIYPVLIVFRPFSLLGGWAKGYAVYMPYSCLGYVLAGRYLAVRKANLAKEAYLGISAFGVLLMIFGTYALSKLRNELYMGFLEGAQLGPFLAAFGLYRYLDLRFGEEKTEARLGSLADAGLAIYLVHYFIVLILRAKGPGLNVVSPLVLIPLEAVLAYALSYLTYRVLKRIKLFNKYLIRRG